MKKKRNITPGWSKKVVWYQIFPERFRNGDRGNDPTLESIKGAYPHDTKSPWRIHPWNSDWYELLEYEIENKRDIWFNLQRRRYGGDIQGIIDKLDYLRDLGIGAIYLNPVFMSPSSHKYDAATFHHIDPYFGPDPENDLRLIAGENPFDPDSWIWTNADKLFLKLIDLIHGRGMKIIIDGVFNHMGLNSWALKDILNIGKQSLCKDWFKINKWEPELSFKTWEGFNELPELKQDKNGLVKGPKEYIFAITKRWMDPNNDGDPSDGIDGWRLDVAYCIQHKFWKEWRRFVKSINPDAYLTAELVKSVEETKPYLQGDEFDAEMNYNFMFVCYNYFIKERNKLSTAQFITQLEKLREAYPDDVNFAMQNLLDSHDTPRLASAIVNKDFLRYEKWSEYHQKSKAVNPEYDTRKPSEDEIELQKLMVLFQMTYIGAPMIYYGDEAGMWGANDPCCRKPMIWEDLNYSYQVINPGQSKSREYKVDFNRELFEYYKKLIHIRNDNIELQLGDFKVIEYDVKEEYFIFERCYGKERTIVIINKGKNPVNVKPADFGKNKYRVLFGGRTDNAGAVIKAHPVSGMILK